MKPMQRKIGSQLLRSQSLIAVCLIFTWILAACNPAPPSIETLTPSQSTLVVGKTVSPTTRPPATRPFRTPTVTPFPTSAEIARLLDVKPEKLRGVIIYYWYPWIGPEGEKMRALVDDFNTSNEWKIIVVPRSLGSPDAEYEQVNQALQNGQALDIVVGSLYQAQVWDQKQPLVDLDIYVQSEEWGYTAEERADFYPVFWKHDYSAGRRLGVPAQRSAQMLFYNLGWARSLGYVQSPDTPDEFERQVCTTAAVNRQDAEKSNDGTGGWMISTNYSTMLGWLQAFGSNVITTEVKPGRNVYVFASVQAGETFTFLRKLYDAGCAWQAESQYTEIEFATRQGLFAAGSLTDIPYQAQAFQGLQYVDEWTVLPFPSPDGKPAIYVYGPAYEILTSSPERQLAAWVFLKWLLKAENQAELVQTSGAFPLRKSMADLLAPYAKQYPQWAAAVNLLPVAYPEPPFQSWSMVRWALTDASVQLFRPYTKADQVSGLLEYLDATASELHLGVPYSISSPTHTLGLSNTLTATVSVTELLLTGTPTP